MESQRNFYSSIQNEISTGNRDWFLQDIYRRRAQNSQSHLSVYTTTMQVMMDKTLAVEKCLWQEKFQTTFFIHNF